MLYVLKKSNEPEARLLKNQYFGDRRDFFKYDLALSFIEQIDCLNSFAFIPMLTKNDSSKDGNVTQYDGSRRKDLETFLRSCLLTSNRNITNLRTFMDGQEGINYLPYNETEFFSHQGRRKYFDGIDPSFLSNSVVLFDPDNGFEIKSMRNGNGHKYLKFEELSKIFGKTSNALVLVYQHIPRVQRKQYFEKTAQQIKEYINIKNCICLSDNEIVFFIMAQCDELLDRAWEIAETYSNRNRYLSYLL